MLLFYLFDKIDLIKKGSEIMEYLDESVETIPSAAPVINALRNIGYNSKTAIADLIDNSIDAKATRININFSYKEGNGFVRIEDNGYGMTQKELEKAMIIGSKDPREERRQLELGRFGMGLKTASFSLGKRLTVVTKKNGVQSQYCWDLDFVSEKEKWLLKKKIPTDIEFIGEIESEEGTIVYIDKLDRFSGANTEKPIKEASFNEKIYKIKKYLDLVFHELINDNLEINVNGLKLTGWDPFLLNNAYTSEGEPQQIRFKHTLVKVTPYILPHPSKFENKKKYKDAGGDKGWYGQQGFYVYREGRLVNYGHWFGLFSKDHPSELVRIKVEFSNRVDEDWKLDIKKAAITLPEDLKAPLKAIARNYRQQSRAIMLYRTTASVGKSKVKGTLKTWELESEELDSRYILNRSHPFLIDIFNSVDEDVSKLLNGYLKLVEMGSPANLLKTENLVPDDVEQDKINKDVISLIKQCAEVIKSNNIHLENDNFVEAVIAIANVENISPEQIKEILGVE